MPDLREFFRTTTHDVEPDPGFLERQLVRQHRKVRRQRIGTYVGVAALLAATIGGVVLLGGRVPSPTPPLDPTVPLSPGLYAIDVATGSGEALPLPDGSDGIAVSPQGDRLAFAAQDDQGTRQIYYAPPTGGDPVMLTHESFGASAPAWSSDGERIAYVGFDAQGDQQVFVVDASGGDPVQVTHRLRLDVSVPVWGAEDASILFDDSSGGDATSSIRFERHRKIFAVDLTTGATTILMEDAYGPDLSPDARRLAFTAWSEFQVAVADIDGTPRITFGHERSSGVKWSPDGSMIAYQIDTAAWGTGGEVLVYDVDTRSTRSVIGGGAQVLDWLDERTLLIRVV
jgi:Tol biopolymer transport system component